MGITQRPSSQPIAVAQGNIEYVERFTYLGSVISRDGDVEADINTQWAKAAGVFRQLDNVWRSSTLSLKIKLDLYTSPLSSIQPYTPVRPGRVQLEYVSSWTSSTSGIYGRFWASRGRTA